MYQAISCKLLMFLCFFSTICFSDERPKAFIERESASYENNIAFSHDGKFVASSSTWDNDIKIWDVATGRSVGSLKGDSSTYETYSIEWSSDGRQIASESQERSGARESEKRLVRIWDVRAEKLLYTVDTETAFSLLDGERLDPDNWKNSLLLLNLQNFSDSQIAQVWNWRSSYQDKKGVKLVALSPDTKWLALGGQDNNIRIWDRQNQTLLHTLFEHQHTLSALAWARIR